MHIIKHTSIADATELRKTLHEIVAMNQESKFTHALSVLSLSSIAAALAYRGHL